MQTGWISSSEMGVEGVGYEEAGVDSTRAGGPSKRCAESANYPRSMGGGGD